MDHLADFMSNNVGPVTRHGKGGTERAPNPSSAGSNCFAHPIANAGVIFLSKCRCVVVVGRDDDIGFRLSTHPVPGPIEPVEGGFFSTSVIAGKPGHGNMAATDSGSDLGHQRFSLIDRFPSGERPPASIIA